MQQVSRYFINDDIFRFITENSSDIITLHEANTKFIYISPVVEQILGYQPKEVMNLKPLLFIHPGDQSEIEERFRSMFKDKRDKPNIVTFIYRMKRKDGSYAWIESTARSVFIEEGDLDGFIAVSRDISERKRMEDHLRSTNESLQKLSIIDALTELYNRRYFDDALVKEWSRGIRNNYAISFIFFDIDYFKNYNDCYGHQAGDECLKAIAKAALTTFPRATDVVARYGGEEFAIILPNTSLNDATKLAEKLRQTIADLQIVHEKSEGHPYVTLSLGVAFLVPSFEEQPGKLVANADKALYKAKQAGRNCAVSYDGL